MIWAKIKALMGWKKENAGFTIVELLIVVVVIAILAAITIVSYAGITNKAYDSAVRSDINGFMKKIELQKANATDGLYPGTPDSSTLNVSKAYYITGRNNWYYCTSTDRQQYALGVVSSKGVYYLAYNGAVTTLSAVDDATTCSYIGKTSGSAMGYIWSGSSGTWSAWLN